MKDLIDTTKERIKKNSTKIALVIAGIASIGCVYFAGKAKGETTLEVNLLPVEKPEHRTMYKLSKKE